MYMKGAINNQVSNHDLEYLSMNKLVWILTRFLTNLEYEFVAIIGAVVIKLFHFVRK